jgi:hypothetical protein
MRRLVGLFLLLGAPLAAQDQAEVARLQRKADSLAQLWSEADALANLADSLAREPVIPQTDTLRVAGLVIVSNKSPLPLKAAAELAWPAIDSLYGSAADHLKDIPYLIQAIDPDSARKSPRWRALQIPWNLNVRETADLLLIYVPIRPADQPFQQWMGSTLRPSPRGWTVELEDSYVALVTAHYAIGQECFLGKVDRCRTLLGLDSVMDPLRLFATLEERQKVARLLYMAYQQAGVRADVIPCLAGSDSSCRAALTRIPVAQLPKPGPMVLRAGLTAVALRVGGREAYTRLMADSLVPLSDRLAHAAGVPLDSLIGLWHGAVVAARPKPVAVPPFGALVGIGWGLVFGLAALRSSRWRVL